MDYNSKISKDENEELYDIIYIYYNYKNIGE